MKITTLLGHQKHDVETAARMAVLDRILASYSELRDVDGDGKRWAIVGVLLVPHEKFIKYLKMIWRGRVITF